jgi:hypothetical protein
LTVFFDVSQVFDKVWHDDTKLKIASHAVIKFYLLHRIFIVKYGEIVTQLKEINFGVLQDNVLGPVLYHILSYTTSIIH